MNDIRGSGQLRKSLYDYYSDGNLKWREAWLNGGINPRTEILSYDCGNPTAVKDARGYITTTTYDSLTHTYPTQVSSPSTTDNPSGTIVNHTTWAGGYDYRFGVPTWTLDEEGNVTDYTYDTFGRLIQVDFPDGGQATTTFDDHLTPMDEQPLPRDVLTTVKEDGSGQTIAKHTYYDGLGRPIQTTTYGEGGKTIVSTNTYDNMGRLSQSDGPFFPTASGEAPPNHPWVGTTFDERGRTKTILRPDGNGGTATTTFSYDGMARSTTVTDPDAMKKTPYNDALGRLIKVVEYSGSTQYATTYAYNPVGDLRTVTDAQGNVTSMDYDTLGRKRAMTDPDMGTWGYTYDQNGNLQTQTDAKGQTITFTYDELNRPMTKSYSTADPTVTYRYDDPTRVNSSGRLFSVSNGLATDFFTYDSMGRAKNHYKYIPSSGLYTTTTTYDLSGKVTKQTYPDNFFVTYAYYPGSGLLKTVTGSDNKIYATYTGHEPTGQIGEIGHGNGTETRYTYNPASTRLTALVTDDPAGLTLQSKVYQYSKAGDVSQIADQKQGVTYSYTYDTLHRLRTETNNGQQTPITYNYDAIGNIISKVAGTAITYIPSTTHKHAVGTILANASYTFSYDPNGNLTDGFDLTNPAAIAARHITYNADNMPLQITRGGLTASITYDGNGARAKKVGPNGTTYYVGPHYEIENGVATKYILAGGERVAKVTATSRYYFHKDHLGSATIMTSDSGTTVERTDYLPFGEMRSHSGSTVANYKFTGQELDPESGLYNYNARLYDPVLGKFISADTIVPNFSDPQSLNRYAYCRNNPLVYVDPSGHNDILDFITNPREEVSDWINHAGNFVQNYGPVIAAVTVAAVVGPWAGAYISGLTVPAGYGCGMVTASAMTEWAVISGAGGGLIAGAAAGATAGGLSAALNGGNVGDAMLQGAGYGAISGGAFGAIGGYYGSHWTLGRVGANALAGGGISELSGQGFGSGALFSGGTALGRFAYNEMVHYDANWNPGGGAVEKYPDTYPVRGANNIGTQGGSINPGGWWNEGGRVSRFANYIPGINAVSGLHDVFQINLDQWGGNMARNIFNVPGMLPAAGITYGALITDMSAVLLVK